MVTLILDGNDREKKKVTLAVDGITKDSRTGPGDLLGLVDEVLKKNGLALPAVTEIKVNDDGGSITGTRMAQAIAGALRYANKLRG